MILHGILTVKNNESRLDETLLASCDAASPVWAGTAFLQNRECAPGDFIVVTGAPRTIGNVAVFCMDDAKPVGASVPNLITVIPKSSPASAEVSQRAAAPDARIAQPNSQARKGRGKKAAGKHP